MRPRVRRLRRTTAETPWTAGRTGACPTASIWAVCEATLGLVRSYERAPSRGVALADRQRQFWLLGLDRAATVHRVHLVLFARHASFVAPGVPVRPFDWAACEQLQIRRGRAAFDESGSQL